MVRVTSLFIVATSVLWFSFGVRALTENIHMLKVV